MSPAVKLTNDAGSEVVINCFGATVTSWKCNGEEILFCSKQAVFDNKKAIRGGIPVVFPNFGPWELGPQHGFARIKEWSQCSTEKSRSQPADGSVSASFILEDDEQTRAMWNKGFKLEYTVTLHESALGTSLSVSNTGSDPFDFTTLLHTYYRVPDIDSVGIRGLKGCDYDDKVKGSEHTETRDCVSMAENYDRVYKKCEGIVEVECGSRMVKVERENLPDVVVWNPWSEKANAMSDFGDEEYKEMVCVEPGAVSDRVQLLPGKTMTFTQKIVVAKL